MSTRPSSPLTRQFGERSGSETRQPSVMLALFLANAEPSIVDKLAGLAGGGDGGGGGRTMANEHVRRTAHELDALVEKLRQAAARPPS